MTPEKRAKILAELESVQRQLRELIAFLEAKRDARR
jgi:hypothetical protein